MKPADIFEEVWVRDIVDLSWEVLRLRRLKASLMTATAYEGLHKILEPLLESYRERDQLVRGWAARDNTAIKRVDGFGLFFGSATAHGRAATHSGAQPELRNSQLLRALHHEGIQRGFKLRVLSGTIVLLPRASRLGAMQPAIHVADEIVA